MGFNVTGAITVSDVRDGISPPTVVLTNENHTFLAEANGDVMDFTGFMSEVIVYVGTQEYTYTAGTPAANQFTIGTRTVVPTAANLDVNVSSAGVITISDTAAATGFAHGDVAATNSATITVPVQIFGFTSSFSRVISITKAIGGSAPFVRIASNTQTVEYDQDENIARTDDIVLEANDINFTTTGTITWTYRSGSTGNFVALAGTGITINTTDPETATLTPTAYNTLLSTNRSVTFRATRGSVFDQITIARVDDGAAAVSVLINVTAGSFILRSDTDVVVLRADVFRGGVAVPPVTSGAQTWTYQWAKNNVNLNDTTAGNATTAGTETGAQQGTGEGFDQRSLRIQGDGIADGTAALFTCVVNEPNP